MANQNIDKRREYVKNNILGKNKEYAKAARLFNCSESAIRADVSELIKIELGCKDTLHVSRVVKKRIIERDNGICQYCGEIGFLPVVDHIIPYIIGGVGKEYNLVLSCQSCNMKKSNRVAIPNNYQILSELNPQWFNKIIATFVETN